MRLPDTAHGLAPACEPDISHSAKGLYFLSNKFERLRRSLCGPLR